MRTRGVMLVLLGFVWIGIGSIGLANSSPSSRQVKMYQILNDKLIPAFGPYATLDLCEQERSTLGRNRVTYVCTVSGRDREIP
jgi:hypothetical protein